MGIDKDMLLILKSSGLGDGEPDLGEKLMTAFLDTLYNSGVYPARIGCLNSGVFLTTAGSPVLEILRKFEATGTEILSCTTCLNYYRRMDMLKIGRAATMKDTVADMLGFKKILTP